MQVVRGPADPERIKFMSGQPLARFLCAALMGSISIRSPDLTGFRRSFIRVVAKLPPGSSGEDVKLMWQDLLGRSGSAWLSIWDRKEFWWVYELVDWGRAGPKLQRSGDGPAKQEL